MSKKIDPTHKPLTVRVTPDGRLLIEIGIEVMAFAALRAPFAWDLTDGTHYEPKDLFQIDDARGFATDVVHALTEEEEDGSSPIADLLDEACRKAHEDGSVYWVSKDPSGG